MVTVSHLVQKYVQGKPFLQEAIVRGIVSYGSLAEEAKPVIEKELGKKINTFAVTMALRRYAEKLIEIHKPKKEVRPSELMMKTNLCDITFVKSPSLMKKLDILYRKMDFEKGDIMNIIQGSYEISIISGEKHEKIILELLKNEKMIHLERGLVSLTLIYEYNNEFLYTPGAIFTAIRLLSWEDINIFEVVSTNTELTFIINKDDLMKGYDCLSRLLQKS